LPRVRASAESIDFGRFGNNVRQHRLSRGWSIDQLAKRAGVAPHTVLRIEQGFPSTEAKRTRLAFALDTVPDRLEGEQEIVREDIAIHSHDEDLWLSLIDSRSQVPEDDREQIQTPSERKRLGRLGFVTQFVKILHCRLPKGKLVSGILELHGPLVPSRYLGGEVFAYALRGDCDVCLGDEKFLLREGEAATLDCSKTFSFAPRRPPEEGEDFPLVLYVRLDEVVPVSDRREKRAPKVVGEFEEWAVPTETLPERSRAPGRKPKRT
jgi:transcriptional regulator with XRE-family HTH domain